MPQDDFPLEALLQKRESERDLAAQHLSEVQREIAALDEAIEKTRQARDEVLQKRDEARLALSADLAEMRRVDEYSRALQAEADNLEARHAALTQARRQAEPLVTTARDTLRDAQVGLEAVSARKDAWLRERKAARDRAEEAEADELALRRWRPSSDD